VECKSFLGVLKKGETEEELASRQANKIIDDFKSANKHLDTMPIIQGKQRQNIFVISAWRKMEQKASEKIAEKGIKVIPISDLMAEFLKKIGNAPRKHEDDVVRTLKYLLDKGFIKT